MKKPFLRRYTLVATCLVCVGLLNTNLALADEGEELFHGKCGDCHAPGGEADVVSPAKYAGVQWERYFKRNRHERRKPISDRFTEEEMQLILEYLKDHAADSDRPIAAGMR